MKDFKKLPKMADGGSVESYESAKAKAPSGIRVPKDGGPSNYAGFSNAKGSFDSNQEKMRDIYNTYKQKDDPDAGTMSRKLGEKDEEAAGRLRRATSAEGKSVQGVYDLKRSAGLKKGGRVAKKVGSVKKNK